MGYNTSRKGSVWELAEMISAFLVRRDTLTQAEAEALRLCSQAESDFDFAANHAVGGVATRSRVKSTQAVYRAVKLLTGHPTPKDRYAARAAFERYARGE